MIRRISPHSVWRAMGAGSKALLSVLLLCAVLNVAAGQYIIAVLVIAVAWQTLLTEVADVRIRELEAENNWLRWCLTRVRYPS